MDTMTTLPYEPGMHQANETLGTVLIEDHLGFQRVGIVTDSTYMISSVKCI